METPVNYSNGTPRHNLFLLEQYFHQHPELLKPVMLCVGVNHYMSVDLPYITHLESDSNYTRIYFLGNPRPLLVRQCLKEFEYMLPKDCFLRVHRSEVINVFMVAHYFPNERRVQLLDGASLLVAPAHLREFKEKFQFWFGQLHSENEEDTCCTTAEPMSYPSVP